MSYKGDFTTSAVVDLKFPTVSDGAPTTLLGTPAVVVYKNNGTTESSAGVTLTVDFDAVTGLNHVRIDTSADGTFYSAGADFEVVLSAGTVAGKSVRGYVVGSFSIANRFDSGALTTILAELAAAIGGGDGTASTSTGTNVVVTPLAGDTAEYFQVQIITDSFNATGWTKATFTMKPDDSETTLDSAALVGILLSNPGGGGDGLITFNGLAPQSGDTAPTSASASLSIDQLNPLKATITIKADAMNLTPTGSASPSNIGGFAVSPAGYPWKLNVWDSTHGKRAAAKGSFIVGTTAKLNVTPP